MNTSEQITALLHGELTDDRSVAELMHILSVSPEKRATFIDHVKTSRQLLRSAKGIAPAPSATQGVWAKIGAMEPGLNIALPVPVGTDVAHTTDRKSEWKRWGMLLLLLIIGIGGGYLLGSRNTGFDVTDEPALAVETIPAHRDQISEETSPKKDGEDGIENSGKDAKKNAGVTSLRSVSKTQANGGSIVNVSSLHVRITQLTILLENERKENGELRREIEELRSVVAEGEEGIAENALNSTLHPAALEPAATRELPIITQAEAHDALLGSDDLHTIAENALRRPTVHAAETSGPWRIEMRQHIRTSLPDVYGLDASGGLFTDRELGTSFEFTAMQRSMRLGVAVGGTSFAQVYHTNTGGAFNDTIIEQAPNLLYGRAYVAPRLFADGKFAGALELGAGGTELGPVGTAGLNLEYRIADRATVHAGVSSWLLWTSFRNQLHTSTNLNAHIGISLNP